MSRIWLPGMPPEADEPPPRQPSILLVGDPDRRREAPPPEAPTPISFADAIALHDVAAARRLVREGAPADFPRRPDAWQGFLIALATGDRAKISRGARAGSRSARSAMARAIAAHDVESIRLLLEEGLDPDAPVSMFDEGTARTPLNLAARDRGPEAGRIQILKLLLAHGADPALPDPEDGLPALHWAAAMGQVAVMEALLDAGASVSQLTDAACGGLLRPGSFAAREGMTALACAAARNRLDAVDLLLRRGADPAAGRPTAREVAESFGWERITARLAAAPASP